MFQRPRIWLVQSGGGLTKGPDKRNLAFTPPRLAAPPGPLRIVSGPARPSEIIRRIMANGGINGMGSVPGDARMGGYLGLIS